MALATRRPTLTGNFQPLLELDLGVSITGMARAPVGVLDGAAKRLLRLEAAL